MFHQFLALCLVMLTLVSMPMLIKLNMIGIFYLLFFFLTVSWVLRWLSELARTPRTSPQQTWFKLQVREVGIFMPLLVRLTVIPRTTLHCDSSRFQPARPLCHRLRFSKWEHRLVSSDTVDRLLLILYRQTPVPKKIINNSAMTDDHQLQGWWVCRAHVFCPHTHTHIHLQCTGLFI